jgi:signal transduction histidine kinase/DNA-binding response OmpR family regulator
VENKTILIVEDDGILAVQLRNMLIELGYSVPEPVATGEEAIAVVTAGRSYLVSPELASPDMALSGLILPDLILMDIKLAGEMDGITAAAHIRSVADVPIVFLTGFSHDPLLQRAKTTAPYGYLVKPVSQQNLVATIEMALYKHTLDRQLKESEERYKSLYQLIRLLCDNVPDMIWAKDMENRFIFVNQAHMRLLNARDTDEPIGKTDMYFAARERADHPDQPDWHTLGEICVDSDAVVMSTEIARRFDESGNVKGQFLFLDVYKAPFRDEQGLMIGTVGCGRDVTREKQLEAEHRQMEAEKMEFEVRNRQLQKVESLGLMAGAIAHHFNNQLHVVMGNLEVTMDDAPRDSVILETLTDALKAARKAAEVSGLMLTYLGQTPRKHEPIDLSKTCRQSLSLLQTVILNKVTLVPEIPSPGPTICADAGQIQQILTNLVTNAWEAVGENNGTIRLTVKTVSPTDIPTLKRFPIDWRLKESIYACLEVADTGCGITNTDIEKLFDPFFTTKFTGRGLGLSVVIGIVQAHGGGVTVESEPSRGSVFRVFLPISTEELPYQPDLPAMPVQTGKTEKISRNEGGGAVLLIEDEEPVRNMARIMLTRLGYAVIEAKDGNEGLERFKQHQDEIRCVLSDLTMPRMNGWETIAALRKLSPDIPVILSSGYDEALVMADEHTERPNAFIGKPYQLKSLDTAIRRAVYGSDWHG